MSTFMNPHAHFMKENKNEVKGRNRSVYPFMAQLNDIKGKGKKFHLITYTKPQASRIWVSLGKKGKEKESLLQLQI